MKFYYESEWKKAGTMCLSFKMGVSIGSEYDLFSNNVKRKTSL